MAISQKSQKSYNSEKEIATGMLISQGTHFYTFFDNFSPCLSCTWWKKGKSCDEWHKNTFTCLWQQFTPYIYFHSQTGHVWKRAERVYLPKFLSFQETCSRPDAQNARMFKSTKTAPFARHWLEKGEFFKQQNAFISRTVLFILHSYHSKDTWIGVRCCWKRNQIQFNGNQM